MHVKLEWYKCTYVFTKPFGFISCIWYLETSPNIPFNDGKSFRNICTYHYNYSNSGSGASFSFPWKHFISLKRIHSVTEHSCFYGNSNTSCFKYFFHAVIWKTDAWGFCERSHVAGGHVPCAVTCTWEPPFGPTTETLRSTSSPRTGHKVLVR